MLKLFKQNCLFTKLITINLFSKVGDRLFYTAMLTTASLLPHSSTAVMVVSASETLPVLLSLLAGTVADQQASKIKLLVRSSLFRAVMYLGIGGLFCYRSTLPLLVMASLLNLLSDISGNYSTALFSPFTKKLVAAEDMERAQGLISLGSQLVNVLATFLGSILLIILNKSFLAMINALIFVFVAFAFLKLAPQLRKTENAIAIADFDNIFIAVKTNFNEFLENRKLSLNLLQLCLLNGFFGGLVPIFTLFIKKNKNLSIFPASLKISLLSGVITLAMIAGNLMGTKILRNQSISNLTMFSDIFIILVGSGFLLNNLYVILIASSLLSLFLGTISPRFSAKVVNCTPVGQLGGIITTVNACLTLVPPITSFLFPMLSNFGLILAYYGFITYGVLLILIDLKNYYLSQNSCL